MSEFQRVSVIGLGYIGLPTAAVLASRKINVLGVDISQRVVDTINNGDVHIVEPDLDIVVNAAVTQGYLRASLTPEPADAFLIAVPTPFKHDHEPDLAYVESATRSIAKVLKQGDLVILESTSPVGTTERVAQWLAEERPDLKSPLTNDDAADFRVAHCPERVLPGHVLTELIQNDRVIGGLTPACSIAASRLYRTFVDAELLITNARTAEMCKLVENSFRDVNIAFANELSVICAKSDINVWELINVANHHPRVNILQPGTGVGGHCIAVDPWFIVSQAKEDAQLIRTARTVNDFKPVFVADKICEAAAAAGTKQVTCLGLAFKPDIDDLRESPAIEVVRILAQRDMRLTLVEPNISEVPEEFSEYELQALDHALQAKDQVVAILVAHKEFRASTSLPQLSTLDFCGATNG
jgi:UDP-N-acetyl-D-mannosaminuronic acid dehydrogenase